MNVHLWKFFISSANFGEKKRSALKRNYMKLRWLAVSSRLRTKPTRSAVQKAVQQMAIASSQMALLPVLLTTSEQRTGS